MSGCSRLAAARALALAGMVLVLAACTAGGLPTPSVPSAAPASIAAVASVTPAPVATPGPTAAAGTARPAGAPAPPAATLLGPAGPVAGDLGTFAWDGTGSDGPWIVSLEASSIAPGATIGVQLAPPIAPDSWTARWAPVRDGVAGDPVASSAGEGGVIRLVAPGSPGSWSLQLEARFAPGRNATWYWRVETGR
jgi:hypothetical protein